MSVIVKAGKVLKRVIKKYTKGEEKLPMSFVRRIERVATRRRVCAMTFDDGPFALPAAPDSFGGKALTDILLDTLKVYGARATFDVIGDTSQNYPDRSGRLSSPQWGGTRFDHYPDISADSFGGAMNQPRLIERMLKEGHEIASHSCRHLLFGPKRAVYGRREYWRGIGEVTADLTRLHRYMKERFGYEIRLARPPHYVDAILGGLSAYDAYHLMGYQYMGASFDGAGWLPRNSYEKEVEDTLLPLEKLLQKDPDALCGQIVFQKDGYNMARRTPIADGLGHQLALLQKYGYEVVTVSELLALSPASDLSEESPCFAPVAALLAAGRCPLYRDNTFRPDRPLTRGEFAMFLAHKSLASERIANIQKDPAQKIFDDLPVTHPYSAAADRCVKEGLLPLFGGRFAPDAPVEPQLAISALRGQGLDVRPVSASFLTRGEFALLLAKGLKTQ